jgi:D-alanine-D-alanine ligase
MKVKREWWKGFFNETYLITDARSVCDTDLTRQEVDLVEDVLRLKKRDRILDLCGGHGRHSLELAKRGYSNLTVLDYSDYLIKMGRRMAKDAGADIRFICADARSTRLKKDDYTTVFIMANSFGYSVDERENAKLLKEVYRLLSSGGKLLLDLTDSDYVKNNLKPVSWHEANDDIIVCRKREIDKDIIRAREIVISKKKGLIRDGYYCERLYSRNRIYRLLKDAGFINISAKNEISLHKKKKDYGFLTSRMVVTAVKP